MPTFYKPILFILIQIARFYDYKVNLEITVHGILYWLNVFNDWISFLSKCFAIQFWDIIKNMP